jgi:hypothetical protein
MRLTSGTQVERVVRVLTRNSIPLHVQLLSTLCRTPGSIGHKMETAWLTELSVSCRAAAASAPVN